jgi:hypothetical protein
VGWSLVGLMDLRTIIGVVRASLFKMLKLVPRLKSASRRVPLFVSPIVAPLFSIFADLGTVTIVTTSITQFKWTVILRMTSVIAVVTISVKRRQVLLHLAHLGFHFVAPEF